MDLSTLQTGERAVIGSCRAHRMGTGRLSQRHLCSPLLRRRGHKDFLKVIMDVAALRIQGMNPVALKAEIENRYKNKTYRDPEKPGLSYMAAPIMRTWMNPDWTVHTMPVPHLTFYAPNLTNEDIGAVPNADHSFPFIFKEGIAEQSYIIDLVGEAEKTKIITDEKALLDDLCAYREFLCLPSKKH